jgi:hypothetical protein
VEPRKKTRERVRSQNGGQRPKRNLGVDLGNVGHVATQQTYIQRGIFVEQRSFDGGECAFASPKPESKGGSWVILWREPHDYYYPNTWVQLDGLGSNSNDRRGRNQVAEIRAFVC